MPSIKERRNIMFEYIFTNNDPEVVINTENFCENIHDAKHEVLKHTSECIDLLTSSNSISPLLKAVPIILFSKANSL